MKLTIIKAYQTPITLGVVPDTPLESVINDFKESVLPNDSEIDEIIIKLKKK